MLQGKWEEVKQCFSFSFHWPPNIETFQGPLSIGIFHWSLNIETFHWPPSWDFFSPPSFSFSLKGEFESFGALFFKHNFQFEFWKYLFLQPSLGRKKWLILVDDGKRESRLDLYSIFERMEGSKDNVGSLKFF